MGQVKKRLREKERWRKGGRETEKVREDTQTNRPSHRWAGWQTDRSRERKI